jgi:hypothetical protein
MEEIGLIDSPFAGEIDGDDVDGIVGCPMDGDPVGFFLGTLDGLLSGEEIGLIVCPSPGDIDGDIVETIVGLLVKRLGLVGLDGAR